MSVQSAHFMQMLHTLEFGQLNVSAKFWPTETGIDVGSRLAVLVGARSLLPRVPTTVPLPIDMRRTRSFETYDW